MAIQFGNLGNVYQIRGELDQAREAWTKARDLFEEVGIPDKVAVTEQRLSELDG